jgi:ABC-2 type transport system permease protein
VAIVNKYFWVFRVTLAERLTYRVDFLLTSIFRFLPLVTTVLLWGAIYQGSGRQELGGGSEGVAFTYRETIAYLLLVQVSRTFSSMPNLATGVAREIRDGSLKRYLIQPLDLVGYHLMHRLAHKLSYMMVAVVPYAAIFWLCRDFFEGWPPPEVIVAWVVSLGLALVLGYLIELSVGLIAFWMLEITSILYIFITINFFLSGHMLPLDLLPAGWSGLLKALPFSYLAYFPAAVFLGKVAAQELPLGLAMGLAWIVVFWVLVRLLLGRGLRRYSAYGG